MNSPYRDTTLYATPPAAALGVAYLTPLMAPTPVATRIPPPANTADTVATFLRVEAGAGSTQRFDENTWSIKIRVSAYAPNHREGEAELLSATALSWLGNAGGAKIVHPSTQMAWSVMASKVSAVGIKHADPQVALVCYRGTAQLTLMGRVLVIPPPPPPRMADGREG